MDINNYYTYQESEFVKNAYRSLRKSFKEEMSDKEVKRLREIITQGIDFGYAQRDKYGINPTVRHLNTALLLIEHIGPDKNMVISVLLYQLCRSE